MSGLVKDPGPGKLPASCLILAGGRGSRLSPDKPLLPIAGRAIIERTARVAASLFPEVLVVTNSPEKYEFLGLPLVADQRRGCGPLMGIYSGLSKISLDVAFVCAADMPFLDPELIRLLFAELGEHDILVPSPSSRPEFLHAFYRRRCLPSMAAILEAGVFRIQALVNHCRTLRLERDWFAARGMEGRVEAAFANVNTLEDYRRCQGMDGQTPEELPPGGDPLAGLDRGVLERVRETLIQQETAFQRGAGQDDLSSLWGHSRRVGGIAHRIALVQGWEPEPACLAGLFHDTGKFAHGAYHQDEQTEEEKALEFVQGILTGTPHEKWIPQVSEAILTMYLEDDKTSNPGRAAFDADSLDKLGCLGVGQFFAKAALRGRFLDEDLLMRAGVELTYAFHSPQTLKTPFGRALARARGARTRGFYQDLLAEWDQLGLGGLDILEEEIGGVVCLMVVPRACSCGGGLDLETDISDGLKCRSALVGYQCRACGRHSRYSFCLPPIKGLPRKESA